MLKMKQGLAFRFAQYLITACMLMAACGTASAESVGQLVSRAQHRDAAAMRTLGIRMYKGGYAGIPTDRKTGLQWLNMAAEKNDDVALLFLGDIYAKGFHVPMNKRKAEDYYRRAKQYGSQNADDRLAKLGVGAETHDRTAPKRDAVAVVSDNREVTAPVELADSAAPSYAGRSPNRSEAEREESVPQIDALSYKGAASSMAAAAKAAGISKIAVIPFMCNGNASTPIAETVRGKLLEEMVEQPGVQCFDRAEMQLVTTEAGLSCPGALPENAEAVLTGEVFCAPSNKRGYVSYRLMSTADSKILHAGFKQVKWDDDELDMFSGSVRKFGSSSFSLIEQSQLDGLKRKAVDKLRGGGIAMVYDGSQRADNTLDARMAYAQVLAALSQTSIALYEREFFQSLAEENSLNGQTANGGAGITAVGHTKLKQSKGTANTLVVQVLGVPEDNLLLTTQLKQVKGSLASASQSGNDGANDFQERLAQLDKTERDVQLVYEAEVLIDEAYTLPGCKNFNYVDVNEYGCNLRYETWEVKADPSKPPCNMGSAFETALRYIHHKHPNDQNKMQNYLLLSALYGMRVRVPEFDGERVDYIGPASLCFAEIHKKVNFVGRRPGYYHLETPHGDIPDYELSAPIKLKGTHKDDGFSYNYEYRVDWRAGLPYKVYAKIDLTPMKDKLLKRINNEND